MDGYSRRLLDDSQPIGGDRNADYFIAVIEIDRGIQFPYPSIRDGEDPYGGMFVDTARIGPFTSMWVY